MNFSIARRLWLNLAALVIINMVLAVPDMSWAANPVSAEGLRLIAFKVETPKRPGLGDTVIISFSLKNESNRILIFDHNFGILVGARVKTGSGRLLNRDFGHRHKGLKLPPGQAINYRSEQYLDMLGDWHFWPAYMVEGRWGPFDSHKVVINVTADPPPEAKPAPQAKSDPKAGETLVTSRGRSLPIRVFPRDNPWNQDVSRLPPHPRSVNYISSIGPHKNLHPDFGSGQKWKVLGVPLRSGDAFGIPYTVVHKGQAKVPVTFTYRDESDPGPYPIPRDAPVEKGDDRHIIVVDYDQKKLYELYKAFPQGNGWKADSGAVFDLGSNRLRPTGWTSADAAGLPIFPGLVRYEEVFGLKEIRHALRFTTRRTQRAFIPPATHFASPHRDPNLPPMGLRVRLRAGFDESRFPEPVQVILRALKRYGMFLADNGGDWFISGAPHFKWDDDQISWLKKVKGREFEAVYTGPAITR